MTKFLKNLAKREIIVPYLNAYIGKGGDFDIKINSFKAKDDHFHPSGDCTPCPRSLYAKFNGDLPARTLDYRSYKTFMVGHFWHAWIQDILVTTGLSKEDDIEIQCGKEQNGWKAVGFADAIVEVPKKGRYLLDFKTMNGVDFSSQAVRPFLLEKWTAQVNCYMDWLGLDQAIIIGIQKDSPHEFREVSIAKDQLLLDKIYAKWDYVTEALKEGIPPHCDCENPLKCDAADLYH